jgi:hypothetical protein
VADFKEFVRDGVGYFYNSGEQTGMYGTGLLENVNEIRHEFPPSLFCIISGSAD